jgi:hypothetical protein
LCFFGRTAPQFIGSAAALGLGSSALPPDVRRGFAPPFSFLNTDGLSPWSGLSPNRGPSPNVNYQSPGGAEPRLTSGGEAGLRTSARTTRFCKPKALLLDLQTDATQLRQRLAHLAKEQPGRVCGRRDYHVFVRYGADAVVGTEHALFKRGVETAERLGN